MLLRLIEDGKPENFQRQIYDLPVIIARIVLLYNKSYYQQKDQS